MNRKVSIIILATITIFLIGVSILITTRLQSNQTPDETGAAGAVCGNGDIEGSEVCDDGNTTSGDGCSATCQTESTTGGVCGNGVIETGELCDDNNLNNGDGCSSVCQIETSTGPTCGNGTVETGEQCDDGNLVALDGCNTTCDIEAVICSQANANPIDFESIPNTTQSIGLEISDQFLQDFGLSFRNGLRVAQNGAGGSACHNEFPVLAQANFIDVSGNVVTGGGGGFQGYNGTGNRAHPDFADSLGEWFLINNSDAPSQFKDFPCQLVVDFERPTTEFSFDLWDLDNGEGWIVQSYDFDGVEITDATDRFQLAIGDLKYNAKPYRYTVNSTTPIFRIEVTPTRRKPNGVGFGLAFDQFSPFCAQAPVCGNSILESGESCDDGNTLGGDGCSAACQLEIPVTGLFDEDSGHLLFGLLLILFALVVNRFQDKLLWVAGMGVYERDRYESDVERSMKKSQ